VPHAEIIFLGGSPSSDPRARSHPTAPHDIKEAGQQVQIAMGLTWPRGRTRSVSQFSRQWIVGDDRHLYGIVAGERPAACSPCCLVSRVAGSGTSRTLGAHALYVAAAFAGRGGVAILVTHPLAGRPHVGAMGTALLLYECTYSSCFSWTFFFSALFSTPCGRGVSIGALLSSRSWDLVETTGPWGPYGAVTQVGPYREPGVTPVSLNGRPGWEAP